MLGIAYGAERDPGAESSTLGMGKHFHLFSEACKPAFEPGGGAALVHRNIRYADGIVDSNARQPDDDGFYAPVQALEASPELVLRPLLERSDVEELPWWVQELVSGRWLQRGGERAASL